MEKISLLNKKGMAIKKFYLNFSIIIIIKYFLKKKKKKRKLYKSASYGRCFEQHCVCMQL